MASISRDELLTILLFASHIAKIDNDFDVWEKKILKRFAEAIQLTDRERAEMGQGEVSLSQKLQSLNTDDARHLLVKMLCAVCYVDGSANPSELAFIERVVSRLGAQVFVLPRSEWGNYEAEVFQTLESLT